MTLLKVSGIRKRGEGGFVLENIGFTQKKAQRIALAGETGSGKSTLLRIIAGLEQPEQGNVIFENEPVKGPTEQLVPGHSHIKYLSQHFELARFLRVEQVLAYANELSDEDAATLFDVCRITHLLQRKTDQLSGGERQRIAIALLLISSPRLLLLDEPFSNLDMVHKNILKSVILDIGGRLNISCILISHDPEDVLAWADQILVMKDGKLIQKGSPLKIYREPVDAYVAGLFGKYTVITPEFSRALPRSFGIKPLRKNIFVRPEAFILGKKNRKSITCKVSRVSFVGSHNEVTINLLGREILVTTTRSNLVVGSTVHVHAPGC